MPLRAAPQAVAAAFAEADLADPASQPQEHREALMRFIGQWMESVETDSLPSAVPCYVAADPGPSWLPRVAEPGVREWAAHLHRMWAALCRQVRRGSAFCKGWLWVRIKQPE